MSNAVRNTGWIIVAAVAVAVGSVPMMLNGLPSEGPEICGGAVTAGVLGVGWWAVSSLRGKKGE